METPLEHAWQVWEAFCADAERRIQESSASGLPPAPAEEMPLRAALAALSAPELEALLDDPRFEETHPDPSTNSTTILSSFFRFSYLLCVLPPRAAALLARRYDDPCRAKSNLPPRAALSLFLTLRWKAFLVAHLRREGAVLALHSYRFQIQGFVERSGDGEARALLLANDPPGLARELAKAGQTLSKAQPEHTSRVVSKRQAEP